MWHVMSLCLHLIDALQLGLKRKKTLTVAVPATTKQQQ
jgi:hypothetical protein